MSRPRRTPPESLPVEPWLRQFAGVEGFLHASAEEPDDDTHRLILADWLEDRGASARAEFIRLQVERARWPAWAWPWYWRAQVEQPAWAEGLPVNLRAERGLFTHLRCEDAATATAQLTEARAHADVQRLTLAFPERDLRPEAAALFATPALASVTALDLWYARYGDDELSLLARSPCLVNLTELRLPSQFGLRDPLVTAAGVRPLVDAPTPPALRRLALSPSRFLPVEMRLLADWPALAGLEWLTVGSFGRNLVSVRTLVRSPHLERLRVLELAGGGRAVVPDTNPALWCPPIVEVLALVGFRIYSVEELAGSSCLPHLVALNLSGCVIQARELATSPHLAHLRVLNLDRTAHRAVLGLDQPLAFPALRRLSVVGIRHDELQALAGFALLGRLEELTVRDTRLGDAGVEMLLSARSLTNLHALDLNNTGLGDAGALALAGAADLAQLRSLDLGRNHFSDEAALALADAPYLTHLCDLCLPQRLQAATRSRLLARWPFTRFA